MDSESKDRFAGSRDHVPSIVQDLTVDNLLPLAEGERYWKLYVFRPGSGSATGLEHRIYTKIKPSGSLAMVTFAAHTPPGGGQVRSGIAHVPDLSPAALERIIEAIRRETQAGARDYVEIDLSHLAGVEDQLGYLRRQA